MPKRPKLGPELKRRFIERGYSMSRVAKELGLFENSLRSWIRRNRFPECELVQLARFAGLGKTLPAISEAFSVEVTGVRRTHSRQLSQLLTAPRVSFDDAAGVIETRVADALKGKDTSLAELQLLFRSLGEEGWYVCVFLDQLPDELTVSRWTALARDFSSAIERGTRCIYVHPASDLVQRLKTQGITRVLDSSAIQDRVNALRVRLGTSCRELSSAELDRRVLAVACTNACFFSPGHAYFFFRPGRQDVGAQRLYLKVHIKAQLTAASPLQPLSDEIVGEFLSQIASDLTRAGHSNISNLLLA